MKSQAVILLLSGIVRSAVAQQPAATEIALLHLGGDSSQAVTVTFHAAERYRLEVTPSAAQIQVRRLITPPAPPLTPMDSATPGGRTLTLAPANAGEYLIELTNPGAGAAIVRVMHEGGTVQPGQEASRAIVEPEARIFNETFPGPRSTVILGADVAYRFEVTGSAAELPASSITIRSLRNASAPPLVLTPLSDPVVGQGGVAYLLIPTSTDEYRVDVQTSDLVRVAIIRDPKETLRWARVGQATRNLPKAGISVRAVAISSFQRPAAPGDTSQPTSGGFGADVCLGAVARGAWAGGQVSGCVLSIAFYGRDHAASTILISIAPRFVLTPARAPTQLSIGISAGLGTTTPSGATQNYMMFGLSGIVERILSRRFVFELEAGLAIIGVMDRPGFVTPRSATALRMALGLQYRP